MNGFLEDTDPRWRSEAACAELVTDDFFPEGQGKHVDAQVARARQVCAACPVAQDCLNFALRTNQTYGIWAGTTPAERRAMRRSTRTAEAA